MSSRPFSLIEVLLVMAIVGLFTFGFSSFKSYRFREEVNKVRSKIELTRELALYKEESVGFTPKVPSHINVECDPDPIIFSRSIPDYTITLTCGSLSETLFHKNDIHPTYPDE